MRFFKRAFLYCCRQKVRTLILFLVLAVISTFMLTSFAIRNAAEGATENVQTAVGGKLLLEIDEDNADWESSQSQYGTTNTYSGDYVTNEIINAISKVDGVVDYNVEDNGVWYSAGVNFEYIPTSWNLSITSYGSTSEYVACLSSEKCSAFESGKYTLVDGRHITPEDSYVILISQELAEYNDLSVGDTVEMYSLDLDWQGYESIVEVEIVGIFNGTEGTSTGNEMSADQMEANCGFIAYNTVFDAFEMDVEYVSLTIYVEDPTSIQNVYDEIAALPELDGKTLALSIDTDEYEVISSPLESLEGLVNTTIVIIAVVSLLILTLLLTLWIRGRKQEIGIYLAIGESKFSIIGQFFTETIAVAIIAFALSPLFSRLIADKMGALLASRVSSSAAELNVQVSVSDLLPVYLIGLGIIALAVIVSSWTVMRLKPRDIFSKID